MFDDWDMGASLGLGFFVAIFVIGFAFKSAIKKMNERYEKDQKMERMGVELERLKANSSGKCPKCYRQKGNNKICACGYQFVEGTHCEYCGNYFEHAELGLNVILAKEN